MCIDAYLFLFSNFQSAWTLKLYTNRLQLSHAGFSFQEMLSDGLASPLVNLCGYLDICTRFGTNCRYIDHSSICILCIALYFFVRLMVYNNVILFCIFILNFKFFVGDGGFVRQGGVW